MSWLLNVAYLLLCLAIAPVLLFRRFAHGKYREGWSEKLLGNLPVRMSDRPCLWLHAVSVGEVLQLQTIVRELTARHPELELVITTTTSTGLGVAKSKFPGQTVCYFPLDFSWAVSRAIARVRPTAIVLVELELWPNFIAAARRAGVPISLVNGRISERSFRGYRRIRPLMKRLLPQFEFLAAQNETYAERLRQLGAPGSRVHVTGSIKFDHLQVRRDNPGTAELRNAFGLQPGDRVFVAGSTQDPEEEIALNVWRALLPKHPDLRLILVPRHQERFEEVAMRVQQQGLPLVRRSTGASGAVISDQAVRLLDTLGELAACWGLADVAFVGGSLTKRGGQNMIEPAGYGAAVCFGPNTWNFRAVVELLLDGGAATVVRSETELRAVVERWLEHPLEAAASGARAQKLVLAQQGATARTIALLETLLPEMKAHGLRQRAA